MRGIYINGRYIPSQKLQPIMAAGKWTPIPIVSWAAGAKAAAQLKESWLITLRKNWREGEQRRWTKRVFYVTLKTMNQKKTEEYLCLFCVAAFLPELSLSFVQYRVRNHCLSSWFVHPRLTSRSRLLSTSQYIYNSLWVHCLFIRCQHAEGIGRVEKHGSMSVNVVFMYPSRL